MTTIEKLTPPATKVQTAAGWDAEIARLTERRAAVARQAQDNEAERGRLALAGEQGDVEAQAGLDLANADAPRLKATLENLDAAVTLARRHRAERAAQEAAAVLQGVLNRHAKALRDRTEAATEIDIALRDLKRAVDKFDAATDRAAVGLNAALAGEGRKDTLVMGNPLAPGELTDLILRRLKVLGIARAVGAEISDVTPGLEDFVEGVRALNRRAELTAGGAARVLHPSSELPPEAA